MSQKIIDGPDSTQLIKALGKKCRKVIFVQETFQPLIVTLIALEPSEDGVVGHIYVKGWHDGVRCCVLYDPVTKTGRFAYKEITAIVGGPELLFIRAKRRLKEAVESPLQDGETEKVLINNIADENEEGTMINFTGTLPENGNRAVEGCYDSGVCGGYMKYL
jgi:hypothetical protein